MMPKTLILTSDTLYCYTNFFASERINSHFCHYVATGGVNGETDFSS